MTARFTRSTLVIAIGSTCLTACPIPGNFTDTTSSPLVGRLRGADGRPVPDVEVAVSTEWGDDACEKPAHRARTDATGSFQLPATQRHYKVVWVIPNLDIVAPRFWLCAAPSDTLRRAYQGYGSRTDSAATDTIECIAWEWESRARVSCNGRGGQAIVTGGNWTDSASGRDGLYRLLLTEEPTQVKGYQKDAPQDRPYVYVQWVEPDAATRGAEPTYRVRASVSLPIDRNKVTHIRRLQLWQREGRWLASLFGIKKSFMNDFDEAELVFELGPPGQAKQVAGP